MHRLCHQQAPPNGSCSLPSRNVRSKSFLLQSQHFRFLVALCFLLFSSGCLPFVQADGLSYFLTIPPHEEECFKIRTARPPESSQQKADDQQQQRQEGEEGGNHHLPDPLPPATTPIPILEADFEQMNEVDDWPESTSSGSTKLSVFVMDASNEKPLYQSPYDAPYGSLSLTLDHNSAYWLCLQNALVKNEPVAAGATHDTTTADSVVTVDKEASIPRTVALSYTVHYETPFSPPQVEIPKRPVVNVAEQHAYEWHMESEDLREAFRQLKHHHDYMHVREQTHRRVAEETFVSLLFWTFIELAAVMLLAVGQIVYFRSFLEQKRYL